jgi:hypothetical protein
MPRIITVDFEGVETGGKGVRVPEGDYGLEVTEVKGKKGEESGKNYLAITFKLTQGDKKGIGKKLPHSCSLQKQSLWNFRNLLEACGKQVPAKAVKIDLDKLIGLECAGTVVDDEYEGRKKSIISAFFPLEDLGNTSESGSELGEEVEEEEVTEKKPAKKKKPVVEEEETEETEEAEEVEEKPAAKKKAKKPVEEEESDEEDLFS